MVIHSRRVCCGTSYFAPHFFRPSIAFTMDFNVGDKVFYTRSMGCAVLPQWWAFHQKDSYNWSISKMQSRW